MTIRLPGRRQAEVLAHTAFTRGAIDRRLFGSFVEHMGRCVYSGIFEPGHPAADGDGFRTDVAELIRELGVTLVRYPGGNFVSGYDWRDGIGPRDRRPRRLDLAWHSVETNAVGVDEFLPWAHSLGLVPMMAVNLGTGGVADAAALVEYCNIARGTAWSDLRRRNGAADPHGVRLWCLGNEMDGPWQIAHKSAEDYAELAAQAGHAMKSVDPSIELVACGSSNREMSTFGSWETTVVEHTFDLADYLSLHAYYDGHQPREDYLASGWRMSRYLDDVIALMDAVRARRRSDKRMKIAFDEWNVWASGPRSPRADEEPESAPVITEDPYQPLDAVVLGDLLISLLNHADRVSIGCLSLLVNVSAPIHAASGGAATRQAIFHPMAVTAGLARGAALDCRVTAPVTTSAAHGDFPALGAAISHDAASGVAAAFLVNRTGEEIDTVVRIDDAGITQVNSAVTMTGTGGAVLGYEDAAGPSRLHHVMLDRGELRIRLPATSWAALDLRVGGRS